MKSDNELLVDFLMERDNLDFYRGIPTSKIKETHEFAGYKLHIAWEEVKSLIVERLKFSIDILLAKLDRAKEE